MEATATTSKNESEGEESNRQAYLAACEDLRERVRGAHTVVSTYSNWL